MANIIQIIISGTNTTATAALAQTAVQLRGIQAAGASMVAAVGGPVGVAAILGGLGVAAVSSANRLSEEVEMLENLSARTRVSASDLRILRQVMVEAGLSPEPLTTALTMLNRNLANGSEKMQQYVGNIRDPMEALVRISQHVAAGGNAARAAFDTMGRGGADLAPVLADLERRVGDLRKRMGELRPETIQAAKGWDELMERMGTSTKSFLDKVAGRFLEFIDLPKRMERERLRRFNIVPNREQAELLGYFDTAAAAGGGGGEPTGPSALEQLLGVYRRFPDTGAGAVGLRRVPRDAHPRIDVDVAVDGKKPEIFVSDFAQSLRTMATESAAAIAGSIRGFIDGVIVYGENVLSALGNLVKSLASQILSIALQIGAGIGLRTLGRAVGGPFGGFLGQVGGALAPAGMASSGGNTYVFPMLDYGTLKTALSPGGALNRAGDKVRIGSRF